MINFAYCTPTRYVFGKGVESQVGELTAAMGVKKVLVVSGHSSARKSGLLDRVLASIQESGVSTIELTGIDPNPTDDRVYEGIDMCRREGVDGVVAVGGGSAIDTAKAIAGGVVYSGDFWDFYEGVAVMKEALPIGVVLTIPAAGSEGSGNSVITRRSDMKKISLRTDMALRPKFAVLNPELTFTLPAFQVASGVVDMMAHIMERYFTPTENCRTTDRVAEGLLRAIIEEAPKTLASPTDYDSRANIMWAGTLAHNGVCGCGRVEDWVSHFMEHEISAVYGVTHGAGLATVFPAWMTFMAEQKPWRVAQFAREVMGVELSDDYAAASEGIGRLKEFYRSIGMPVTMGELGVESPDIELLTSRLHRNKGAEIGGYYRLTAEDTRKIYELML